MLPPLIVLPPYDELSIGANGGDVRRASAWLESACRQRAVPQAMAEKLVLSLNEVLANVIRHGGANARSAPVGLRLEVIADAKGGKAGVTVSDAGIAFNPLSVPERPRPKTLDDAAPGGLGLVMIRRFSDWLDYRHEDGCNHLTFGTRWETR